MMQHPYPKWYLHYTACGAYISLKNSQVAPATKNHLLAVKQLYTLRAEYKNTLREFFVTGELAASNSHVNHTFEQRVSGNVSHWTRRYVPHHESVAGATAIVSKGFYDIGAKSSLETSFWHNRSAQLRDGILQPFSFHTFTLVPKLSFSPAGSYEISYEGGLRRSSSSFGNPLWNTNHRLSLHYTHRRLDASVSGEYFRNQIGKNNSVNLFSGCFRRIQTEKTVVLVATDEFAQPRKLQLHAVQSAFDTLVTDGNPRA